MSRREIQSEGKDVATAIIRGLNELGRRRDQVEVTVIQEEKSGFLGIGGRPAIVRIIEKKWDSEHSTPMKPRSAVKASSSASKGRGGRKGGKDFKKGGRKAKTERIKTPKENEPQKLPSAEIQNAVIPEEMKPALQCAKETLAAMISSMGVKAENLNVWWDGKQHRVLLTFDCDHPAIVIGKEGKTLESIQYIITLVVSRRFNTPVSVMADTQNYWRKLEDKINNEIGKALSMVKRTKRIYRFRPMSAQMRRYIHRFLADNLEITTVSEGEGKWRKVIIKPEARTAADTEEKPAKVFVEQEASAGDIAKHSEDAKAEECAVISADNAACDCVLTAESAGCACVADTNAECKEQIENAEINAKAEALPVEAPAESASVAPEAEVKNEEPKAEEAKEEAVCAVSADNAACDCVLTAESTSCACVADTAKAEENCAFASNANASCSGCAYAQSKTTADEAKTNADENK